jgi:SAM-dependent methyltransferase
MSTNDWDQSAGHYAAYASQKTLYRDSAKALVELAGIEPGMTVLDLACGSGVVTETILSRPYAKDVDVIAVDASAGMLARARSRITSPRVRFYQGAAEKLSEVVPTKVDRVLCNAAFWHFDKAAALSQIHDILKPAGKCLLSLPVQDFKFIGMERLYSENKLIWMVMEEKAIRGYLDTRPADTGLLRDFAIDKNEVSGYLSGCHLQLSAVERIAIQVTAMDYLDFLRIPIMARKSFLFRGLPDEEVRQILGVVENQLQWVEASVPPAIWNISILQSAGS